MYAKQTEYSMQWINLILKVFYKLSEITLSLLDVNKNLLKESPLEWIKAKTVEKQFHSSIKRNAENIR